MSTLGHALAIAASALEGATDKNGAPTILHCCRVVDRVGAMLHVDDELREPAMVVAALHDALEDAPKKFGRYPRRRLVALGFSDAVCYAVLAITRGKREDYLRDYIPRVCANRLASLVKLADLDDNLNRAIEGESAAAYVSLTERYWKARHMVSAALLTERS